MIIYLSRNTRQVIPNLSVSRTSVKIPTCANHATQHRLFISQCQYQYRFKWTIISYTAVVISATVLRDFFVELAIEVEIVAIFTLSWGYIFICWHAIIMFQFIIDNEISLVFCLIMWLNNIRQIPITIRWLSKIIRWRECFSFLKTTLRKDNLV